MPICTSCARPTVYLYTVYDSAYNFRLEQCTACHAFADPYVEHDTLTLLLDLILLKRDVYRHLLYNRGLGARRAGDKAPTNQPESIRSASQVKHTDLSRWWLILKLGSALICVDAFIRWTHLSSSGPGDTSEMATWNRSAIEGFVRILVGCLFGMGVFLGHPAPQLRHMSNASLYWPRVLTETVAFHAGVVLACYAVLKLLPSPQAPVSGIRGQFRYSHIPLTLFYSSLTKLFLLFCLSIWRPDAAARPTHGRPQAHPNATTFGHSVIVRALELLDEDKLNREWVVRNVLGGMSAGFGLRVVLDCHPLFTTMIIIAGWLVKTAVANLVSGWVGTGLGVDDRAAGEMWLAYSIP
ncbi:Arv1-domain-containing protein [Trametes sanguinea]|nr:Arv1-domain-containing protein [Trametes sanguinea]